MGGLRRRFFSSWLPSVRFTSVEKHRRQTARACYAALGEASRGFVWRLKSDEEIPKENLIFDDPSWIVNLAVWKNLDSLMAFVRSDLHLSIMKRRREWFSAISEATMVLWWVPEGHIPTVAEAQERLEALRKNGPSEYAFGFSEGFPAPSS